MKPRHLFIVVLELIVVLGVLDVAGLHAFDELAIAGYFLLYCLPAIALFIVSVIGFKTDAGYLRGLDLVGITLSIGSILLTLAHFMYAYFTY